MTKLPKLEAKEISHHQVVEIIKQYFTNENQMVVDVEAKCFGAGYTITLKKLKMIKQKKGGE